MNLARSIMDQEPFVPSLEQVHALATANLVVSTQRDIALQLAEASFSSLQTSGTKINQNQLHKPEEAENIATANLGPSIQRDITRQLVEASLSTLQTCDTDQRQSHKSQDAKNIDAQKCLRHESDKKKSTCLESHAAPKALVCSLKGCGRKFAWNTHLKYHEMTHTNNRQFECPNENCRKTFFTAQNLSVHLRTHTGEKPFKCNYKDCGKSFTTAGNLKNHHRIHTGEQPFVCNSEGCNRRFTEYSSLKKHKLTHTGDKPYECTVCKKKFAQSGSRRQHLLRHHLNEEITQSLRNSHRFINNSNRVVSVQDSSSDNTSKGTQSSHSNVFDNGLNGIYGENLEVKLNELIGISPTHFPNNGNENENGVYHADVLERSHNRGEEPYPISNQLPPIEQVVGSSMDYHQLPPDEYSGGTNFDPQCRVSMSESSLSKQTRELLLFPTEQDYTEVEHRSVSATLSDVGGEISTSFLLIDGAGIHEELIETTNDTIGDTHSSNSSPVLGNIHGENLSSKDSDYSPLTTNCDPHLMNWHKQH